LLLEILLQVTQAVTQVLLPLTVLLLRLPAVETVELETTVYLAEPHPVLIQVELRVVEDHAKALAAVVARLVTRVMAARLELLVQQTVKRVRAAVLVAVLRVLATVFVALVKAVVLAAAALVYLVKALVEPQLPKIRTDHALSRAVEAALAAVMVVTAVKTETQNRAKVVVAHTVAVAVAVALLGLLAVALEPFVLFGPDARAHFPQPV
jgi:hypothetical protein